MARRGVLSGLLGAWPSFPLAVALAAGTVGCGAEFDSPVQVETLRILGVHKSAPYAKPGEDVEMTMLWHDGTRDDDGEPRDVDIQRIWIGGCVNPPGDFYFSCAPQILFTLAALRAAQAGLSETELMQAAGALAGVESEAGLVEALRDLPFDFEGPLPTAPVETPLAMGQFGVGDRFVLPMPADAITRFPESRPPYGVAFPFFAACAGTLHVSLDVLDQTVPIVCKDEDGKILGSDDFVIGYASVYAYEELENQNAVIDGFEVDGFETAAHDSPFLCVDDECLVPDEPLAEGEPCTRHLECASEHCEADVCAEPVQPDCGVNVPCVDPCAADGNGDECKAVPIRPLLDPNKNVEVDPISSVGGETFQEQMWVNYHVDLGGVGGVVRLVNDSTKGWNDDYGTDLFAPKGGKEPRKMYVWAVVRDNRGGTSWVRQTVFVRAND
jgi:hypothetical protein